MSYLIFLSAKFVFPISKSILLLPIHVWFVLWRWCWGAHQCDAVGGVTTLGHRVLSGAVNNYWHCHYRPSLNSLRLFRVAGIYRVLPRWAGGVTNVSEMNVFCDRTLSVPDAFLLRLFPGSTAKTPADGESWQGGLPPPCPHSGSQQA